MAFFFFKNTPVVIDDMRKGISSKELNSKELDRKKKTKQKHIFKKGIVTEIYLTMKSFQMMYDDCNNIHKRLF